MNLYRFSTIALSVELQAPLSIYFILFTILPQVLNLWIAIQKLVAGQKRLRTTGLN
jgi:hypothetical protein